MKFISDPRTSVKWAKLSLDMRCIESVSCFPKFNDTQSLERRDLPKLPNTVEVTTGVLEIEPGVRLVGHKWLLGENGEFCCDEVFEPPRILNMFNSDRDAPITVNKDGVFSYMPGRRSIVVKEKVGIAVASEPSNWGSFIFRIIPKLVLLKTMGCKKILVYCRHESQREAIRSIGFDDDSIITHHPSVEYVLEGGAYYPMALHLSGYLTTFARVALSTFPRAQSSRFGKLIYVSRGSSSKRRCVNEDEITAMLTKYGFSIMYPGELSFSEQVEVFSAARFVIGPSGAAMFNVAFCQAGTTIIDIESQPWWKYAHCNFFSSLRLDYGIFWGTPIEKGNHAPFMVDVDALERRVQQCIIDINF